MIYGQGQGFGSRLESFFGMKYDMIVFVFSLMTFLLESFFGMKYDMILVQEWHYPTELESFFGMKYDMMFLHCGG